MQKPAFIAFTGVDRTELLGGMQALSGRYPIEWGLLVDPQREVQQHLFANNAVRQAFRAGAGLRLAAHVCGQSAAQIATEGVSDLDLSGFSRIQVNHSFAGSNDGQIAMTRRFGNLAAVRTVLQCWDPFPNDLRVDWLFDVSFGTGQRPTSWPVLPVDGAFCGYSGGIGPANVAEILATVAAPAGAQYWIDMESGVRTDGWFDLAKCEAVCRAVFG